MTIEKRATDSLLMLVIFLQVMFSSCSYGTAANTNNNDTLNAQQHDVILKTGDGDYTEWSITSAERVENYYTPSLDIQKGRAIMIKGEVRTKCLNNCDFFIDKGLTFFLTDIHGSRYNQQAPIVELFVDTEGTLARFTVFFSFEGEDINIYDQNAWSDYIIQDADPEKRKLPDHETDLSVFDSLTV